MDKEENDKCKYKIFSILILTSNLVIVVRKQWKNILVISDIELDELWLVSHMKKRSGRQMSGVR